MRFMILLLAASLACASATAPDGTEVRSFGVGQGSVSTPVCPDPPPADPAECPVYTLKASSEGISDNFLAWLAALVRGAAGVFGFSGEPPAVNVTVEMPDQGET